MRGVERATIRQLKLAQARQGDRKISDALEKVTRLYEVVERASRAEDHVGDLARRFLEEAGFTAEAD